MKCLFWKIVAVGLVVGTVLAGCKPGGDSPNDAPAPTTTNTVTFGDG